MPSTSDITPLVAKYSALTQERVRIVKRFEELPLTQIRQGVVYLLAAWSGPSITFFCRITEALARLNFPTLEFFVVDIDCVPSEFMEATFERRCPVGAGETLWIRDGVVVASVLVYPPGDMDAVFLKHTTDLI